MKSREEEQDWHLFDRETEVIRGAESALIGPPPVPIVHLSEPGFTPLNRTI
jgi:hypothetical protein